MKPTIVIDVVSDIVCPWCYIGKARLDRAIEACNEFDFQIQYQPFELHPEMPMEGLEQKTFLEEKFGSAASYDRMTGQVTRIGAEEGLDFRFDRQLISPNTRKAHVLLLWAKTDGKQRELADALFKAYFTDGIDLSKDKNLITIATATGLDRNVVQELLQNDEVLEKVESTERELQKLGIRSVPFYILNNQFGVSGAQPTEVFIKIFKEVAAKVTHSG